VITLYNTLSRKKEPFEPLQAGRVNFYSCGPTVYDFFHIGNARVFIVVDALRRYLSYRGYDVNFVQNYTDIDDKMINRAAEQGVSVSQLAEQYIQAYRDDAASLKIKEPDYAPRATEHVPQIIEIIKKLLDKDLAYEVDGDVYYYIENFPQYGKLSQQGLEELSMGARIEVDDRKRHPMDFVLWKKEKPGEPSWESPWGRGRPGWHIECSAMSMHYLGQTVDIHAGGQDLIFPHHENEIAQSEGATGKTFVQYWTHVGYLNINKEKMSKSLGNVLTVRELLKKIDPYVLRFFMLSSHYRNPMNFSDEQIQQASSALERLHNLYYNLKDRLSIAEEGVLDRDEEALLDYLKSSRAKFIEVLDDDFNTAEAIAVLFELLKEANIYLNRAQGLKKNVLEPILNFYKEVNEIFDFIEETEEELEQEIKELISKREEARKKKDFATADAIRDDLKERGIILEDTPQGVRWKKISDQKSKL